MLAATRLFSGPLHYALLEGIVRCPRCNLTERTPDSDPLVRAHRRLRGVVVASDLADAQGFIEVDEQSLLTVGPDLQVRVAPLARY